MNWDQIESKWSEVKSKAKDKWQLFSDDELDKIQGRLELLKGKLQEKYSYTKQKAEDEIENFRKSLH